MHAHGSAQIRTNLLLYIERNGNQDTKLREMTKVPKSQKYEVANYTIWKWCIFAFNTDKLANARQETDMHQHQSMYSSLTCLISNRNTVCTCPVDFALECILFSHHSNHCKLISYSPGFSFALKSCGIYASLKLRTSGMIRTYFKTFITDMLNSCGTSLTNLPEVSWKAFWRERWNEDECLFICVHW